MQEISRDLIDAAAGGDIEAFEEIYRRTSGYVYSVALRITSHAEDAQEVTQDVFLKVHDKLKEFEFRSSFTTWIYRVTVNTAINLYNRRKRHTQKNVNFDDAAPYLESAEAPVNEKDDEKEAQARELLEKLNPDQKACVVLRELEGLSYEEIANALGININTVKTRLKRAREKMMSLAKEMRRG